MRALGLYASISWGVKKPDYDTVDQLVALGLVPEYITIDIAHGHADSGLLENPAEARLAAGEQFFGAGCA
jgi:hypothetical protein